MSLPARSHLRCRSQNQRGGVHQLPHWDYRYQMLNCQLMAPRLFFISKLHSSTSAFRVAISPV